MDNKTAAIIIIIIIGAYFFYQKYGTSKSTPVNLQGTEGLQQIKNNRASDLDYARNLCVSQFQGSWVNNQNEVGCYNMVGFSSNYCSMMQDIINQCNSIGGNVVCTSTQASCSV
jgi:hypothetical protein